MPRPPRETKRQIMDAAYGLFYKEGYARTGVDEIAAAAGITKRTLYYHFPSKEALIAAVLEAQNELMLARISDLARRATGDNLAAVVRRLFTAFAAWAREPRWRGSGFTRAAMEYAHLPGHPARRAARRHKAAVEDWLAAHFSEQRVAAPRELARQIMLLLEGCHCLVLIHGDPSYIDAAAEAAVSLVARSPQKRPKQHRGSRDLRR